MHSPYMLYLLLSKCMLCVSNMVNLPQRITIINYHPHYTEGETETQVN